MATDPLDNNLPGQVQAQAMDKNLISVHKLIEDARRDMLKHDPGTSAQEQAWRKLKHFLEMRDRGQAWVPKF